MELIGILAMALGFGLIHALDADHLLAVSGLSGMRRDSLSQGTRFCLRWAVGHGSSVLLIGSLVVLAGMAIPDTMSGVAEQLVGLMLLVIGVMLLLDLARQKNSLYIHRHDSLPVHVHLENSKTINPLYKHRHGSVMVGLLHGVAGSAPLLALLPVSQAASPQVAMLYLVVFCLGVLIAMLIVGGLLGSLFKVIGHANLKAVNLFRAVLGLMAVSFGVSWLLLGSTA